MFVVMIEILPDDAEPVIQTMKEMARDSFLDFLSALCQRGRERTSKSLPPEVGGSLERDKEERYYRITVHVTVL
jgi:hypothetical protein